MKRKGRKQAKSDADLGDGFNNYNYYCISVSITYRPAEPKSLRTCVV